ncbi:uncharacterized protein LOC142398284 [Odontesthes bonariensis]|uniref:uncharacterized protein LOC142398284 n=1 Tax=Odontesthes bonariensis TaxID=219752 RepID=UPI003F588543
MSNTPIQDPPAQGLSSDSGQTLPSRPLQSISEPSTSKRVCFYKSGDYTFSGHRMIITARTFKTFDALLDALSKKVPLPFGVRTITTPRGTHLLKALDDLQDGGSYVCSDQKRVKPLNLDEVSQRQVPWNTTRPPSAGRRRRQRLQFGQSGKGNNAVNRPAKVTQRVVVRTPKKLVVIKNRDPTVKRTVVLQRRIAPTFDALLDYLSQILQFPVLKLYSTEGRRVDSLPALILCSGVVVAAGNEPFRLGNNSFHKTGQKAQVMYMETEEPLTFQPVTKKNKSVSSGRGSRNFSLSSERYIVNQINKSQNGSMNGYVHNHSGSIETEANQPHEPVEMCGTGRVDDEHQTGIVPHDDDIEKSFRVNQDGSMTVEMKVRLTIKEEEEMLHWTTTLSRSSLNKRTVCASVSGSGNSSPDSNNAVAKDSSNIQEDESKEENYNDGAGKGVGFNDERLYEGYSSTALGKAKQSFKRPPTPGPRHVNKKTSVESVKMITETGVQESTLGHYSYVERTADGETTEGYCVVRHSSSSSNRPIPKPRKTASAGANNNRSSVKSSEVAEVLQIRNDGMEVTETVMHIYESQGCFDNYFANDEYSPEGASSPGSSPVSESKPSTESRPPSSSNDCDIDCNWQPPTADSPQRQKEEMLSLSSERESLTHQVTNSLTSLTENEAQAAVNRKNSETVKEDNNPKSKKKKNIRPVGNEKNSASSSITDKKQKESIIGSSKHSRYSSTDKLSSDASAGKKSLNSLISSKSSLRSKGAEKPQPKRAAKDEKSLGKDSASLVSSENVKRTPSQRQNANKTAGKDNGYNVNTPTGRPQMKKNISDIFETKKSLSTGKRTASKPKSMIEYSLSPPKKSLELSESGSMPSLNPTPSLIHQYVEDWLEKVSPDQVPYTEEAIMDEADTRTRVIFKIGDDSESDEINECQSNLSDVMKKSPSCLSVPIYHEGPVSAPLLSDHRTRGLCVSMPSVSADPVHHENRLRSHKSTEAIVPDDSEISTSNILSPKAKIKPVLRQLCSSIQCIRRASASNEETTLHNSNSLPDFSKQVTSVFGSSCKAFMSFLSVVTLRESLNGSVENHLESNPSRTTSEAMLMMESLQRISTIEDEDEQRASLTDLQSRASSQLRERWNDFQILRERLESEPLSPRVSETEFALDVVSEVGDAFEDQDMIIDELMDELNMPQELRAEITSTIQQAKSFYPVEESTFVETVRNQSDTEEDVEQFVKECSEETKHSPEPNRTIEDITKVTQGNDKPEEDQELQTENNEPSKDKEKEAVEQVEIRESENTPVIETDEENDNEGQAKENGNEEGGMEEEEKNEEQEDGEEEKESDKDSVEKVEEGTEGEITGEVEEMGERLEVGEKEETEETDEGLVEDETGEENSDIDTDEREAAAETQEEDKSMEGETEERPGENEEEAESIITEKEEKEEEDPKELGEEEEVEETDAVTEKHVEEDVFEETNEEIDVDVEEKEKEEKEQFIEMDEEEEEEETDAVTEKHVEEDVFEETNEEIDVDVEEKEKEEKEQFIEMDGEGDDEEEDNEEEEQRESEEDNDEEEQRESEEDNEEEEQRESEEDNDSEKETEEEKCDVVEDSRKVLEKTRYSLMEESTEEKEVIDESEVEENMAAEQTVGEEEQGSVEENKLDEGLKHMEAQSTDEIEKGHVSEDVDSFADDEASPFQQPTSSCEDTKSKHNAESPATYSSEGQGEDDKGVKGETDEVGEEREERSSSSSHQVEISQELLDFVNHALQSCALIFTYDTQGKVRIEPEDARVVQTKQSMIPKGRKDSSYGLKCLPSPNTSDLSDYRPETSESGGYKTQESLDIVSESGEEASGKCFQVRPHSAKRIERTYIERDGSKLSVANSSDALHNSLVGSFSSTDTGIKASREDLSYLSAASSLKGDTEADTQNVQCISFNTDKDSADGVLIDRGRWLLKENHLIRKSPPVTVGMYGNFDSTSMDTGQENTSEDSPPHSKTQHRPLAALSSSELEDMAKPLTPKCTYYNMPHGSDSDPFLDDSSIRSGKQDSISVKGRGFRVSPTVDTSKTWANRNGSLSSFASVEFKIPDRKVHPEGESSAVTQARRTPSGEQVVLQAQDSLDSLQLRCSQYCPIL